MAVNETSVCNLALALLGQATIMSLNDESQAARFCSRLYAQTRDEVLQAHRWNFALKRATLAKLSDGQESEWAYAYQLPVDVLRVLELNGHAESDRFFEIEGRRLLTDEVQAVIRYIRQVTDAVYFTPLFVEALSVKLASKLALPLMGSRTMADELAATYERVIGPKARRMDAVEGNPRRHPAWMQSDLVKARY